MEVSGHTYAHFFIWLKFRLEPKLFYLKLWCASIDSWKLLQMLILIYFGRAAFFKQGKSGLIWKCLYCLTFLLTIKMFLNIFRGVCQRNIRLLYKSKNFQKSQIKQFTEFLLLCLIESTVKKKKRKRKKKTKENKRKRNS